MLSLGPAPALGFGGIAEAHPVLYAIAAAAVIVGAAAYVARRYARPR